MTPQKTLAIQTALHGDWQKAIEINQEILSETPDDIDTLNRIAFAYTSVGNISEAKKCTKKFLSLMIKTKLRKKT